MRTYLISDLHFGHKNIIDYESRPFEDLDHQDKCLIDNWNAVIGKHDMVFVLGDFSFYGKEKTKQIVSKLNGHKLLVMGNHDKGRTVSWWRDAGFDEVSYYPIMINDFIILSHEPVYLNPKMPYVNIHGHIHSNSIQSNGTNQYFNVCIDANAYYPTDLESIKKKIKIKEGDD